MRYLFFLLLFAIAMSPFAGPVKIPLNDWASQRVLSRAIGLQLQENEMRVEYVEIASEKQWGALSRGHIHFQIEVWESSMSHVFQQYKNIVEAGTHAALVREEWWYPDWVEPLCPGLPDWRALNQCAHLFSLDGGTKGTYYKGPWLYKDAVLIRALSLNFNIKRLESDIQLWELLFDAQKNRRPILLLNWTPNWIDNRFHGSFVTFPPYSKECESIASHGLNQQMTHDCGNTPKGWLKKAKWRGLKNAFPCVDAFIENINFTNAMVSEASALHIADKLTEQQAAQKWNETFREERHHWFPIDCVKPD